MALNKRKKDDSVSSESENTSKKTEKTAKSKVEETKKKSIKSSTVESSSMQEIKTEKKLNKTNLKDMKKSELVELAISMNLQKVSSLKKEEIIEIILQSSTEEKRTTEKKEPKKLTLTEEEGQTFTSVKKYEVENIDLFIEPQYPIESRDLPREYGDTNLTLLIRDPWWAFIYWEISDKVREEHGLPRGHSKRLKIRVYDITDGKQNGFFDVYVHDYTTNWYINLPLPNRRYYAELILEENGKDISIVRSNEANSPRISISQETDIEWMTPDWAKIYAASAGFREKGLSEKELSEKLSKMNLSSMSFGGSVETLGASESLMSSLPSSESVVKVYGKKDFWLRADCELIVYGATEPDAGVKVKGEVVKLNRDGSFTLRFALPNGSHLIDIKAINRDRDMERQIEFYITRETK